MSTAAVANNIRRSLLSRVHQALGANYVERHSQTVLADYGNTIAEIDAAKSAGLCDLSMAARWGCKGKGAPAWMASQGWTLPEAPNWASLQADGNLLARLSNEECLLLTDVGLASTRITELEQLHRQQLPDGVYSLPRADSHACFVLSGHYAAEVMSKLCAVDLRANIFANGCVAQTSVARVNAIVIRNDIGKTLSYYLLSDLSSSEYLWECLLDAMEEFGGRPVGHSALEALSR